MEYNQLSEKEKAALDKQIEKLQDEEYAAKKLMMHLRINWMSCS